MTAFKEGDRVTVTVYGRWQAHEGTVVNDVAEGDEESVLVRMDEDDEVRAWFGTELEVFDPAPQKGKTKEQMEAIAKKMFGPNATVRYNDGWIIETHIEEFFDPEPYKDRPAYKAYSTPEGTYGNALERWAYKNGHSGESMAELFDSYDAEQERNARDTVASVRRWVAEGREFDWDGGPEWRDEVLKYAEERGW